MQAILLYHNTTVITGTIIHVWKILVVLGLVGVYSIHVAACPYTELRMFMHGWCTDRVACSDLFFAV